MTTLGKSNGYFTINGVKTFLLGASYFDVLNWHSSDIDALAAAGFNCIRIILDKEWDTQDGAESVFNADGSFNTVKRDTALACIQYANTKGMVVDVTILYADVDGTNSAAWLTTVNARKAAIQNAVSFYGAEPNVFFDVMNEHNLGVDTDTEGEMTQYVNAARAGNASAIVFYSSSNQANEHIVTFSNTANGPGIEAELANGIDCLAAHLWRNSEWATAAQTRVSALRNYLNGNGHTNIVLYMQEEKDRFTNSLSTASEMLTSALGARAGGAAGWVFHSPACYRLNASTYSSQLDSVETLVLNSLAGALGPLADGGNVSIFFDDDFESGFGSWTDGGTGAIGSAYTITTESAYSGTHSVKEIRNSLTTGSGPVMERFYPSSDHVFYRMAIYPSAGYQYSPNYTKLFGLFDRYRGSVWPNAWVDCDQFGNISVDVQGAYDRNDTEVLLTGTQLTPGMWHQLQIEWQMNTPGLADGYIKFWHKQGSGAFNLVLNSTGRQLRGPTTTSLSPGGILCPSDAVFNSFVLYRERGIGTFYWDRLAAGNTAIGEIGGSPPPTITISPSSQPAGTVGVAYAGTSLSASGGTGPYTYTATGIPAGVSLSSAGVWSGTPTTSNTYNTVVTATDANGAVGTKTYAISIGGGSLVLSPTSLSNGTVGAAYSQQLSTAGGGTISTPTVQQSAKASGSNVASLNVSFGVLPAAGADVIVAVAAWHDNAFAGVNAITDNQGNTYTKIDEVWNGGSGWGAASLWHAPNIGAPSGTFTVTVDPIDASGVYLTAAIAEVRNLTTNPLDQRITASLAANTTSTCGPAPTITQATEFVLAFLAASGADTALNLTVPAGYTNIQTEQDSSTASALQVSYYVSSQLDSPSATWSHDSVATASIIATFKAASSGSGTITYSVSSGALPPGMSLASTGLLSGTPTLAGTYTFTAKAADSVSGLQGTRSYTLVVSAATPPPGPSSTITSTITWTDNSNNEAGFELECSINGKSRTLVATLPAGTTSTTHTVPSAGTYSLEYYVRSFRDNVNGARLVSQWAGPATKLVDNVPPQAPLGISVS